MTKPAISPAAFDAVLTGNVSSERRARIIWTAEAIGQKIGCSADYVRSTLVHIEGSPVRKIGTRYCAHEGDLIAFFRAQPIEP